MKREGGEDGRVRGKEGKRKGGEEGRRRGGKDERMGKYATY
jgi:hypothetical protein